jgi:hypothetical protein
MGCCNKRSRSPSNRVSVDSVENEVDLLVVYIVCRICGTMKTVRYNLAKAFVTLPCEDCNQRNFKVLRQPPTPIQLKKLVITR